MLELTTEYNFPVFFDINSIELIEQKDTNTCIHLKSGKKFHVIESAPEIILEINAAAEANMLARMGIPQ